MCSAIDQLAQATHTTPRCPCVKNGHGVCTRFADWFANSDATLFPVDEYDELCRAQNGEVARSISVDIGRTFPRHVFFRDENNCASLKRLLVAYAAFDKEIGYVQGLNFIAGFMLWHSGSEVIAFSLLVALMRETPVETEDDTDIDSDQMCYPMNLSMRQLFLPNLIALKTRCFIVQQICFEEIPDIFGHLLELGTKDGSPPDTFLLLFTDVFLTLFSSTVPFLPLARIWDLFFAHGWLFLCHLCVARLYTHRRAILVADDMVSVHRLLREQPGKIEERGQWRKLHRESNRMWFHLVTQALGTLLADHNFQLRKALTFTPKNVCGHDVVDDYFSDDRDNCSRWRESYTRPRLS